MRATPTPTPDQLERFPFLFGGTFIEGQSLFRITYNGRRFPFLFGGTFIEGRVNAVWAASLTQISLPFRRDFH